MKHTYLDIHCHPGLKPYSKSYKYPPYRKNELNDGRKNSIWHYSPPNALERAVNRLLTLTKFTQTDFTALAKANTSVVIVSLYPFEKGFFKKDIWGIKGITDLLVNLASGISQRGMNNVRNHQNYFNELVYEYHFYKQLENQVKLINGKYFTYRIVKNYQEIEANNVLETESKKIISLVISIEGGHAFNTGINHCKKYADENEVLTNIEIVKGKKPFNDQQEFWQNRPLFITLAHHFYNELCGQAPSINISYLKKIQAEYGFDIGITTLGKKVINLLLDNSQNDRILIDLKHMSIKSRMEYYEILASEKYKSEIIPLLVSHGAVNGKSTIYSPKKTNYPEKQQWFNDIEINFYDDELIKIAKSNGIFGLQLDQRRIGSKKALRKSNSNFFTSNKKRLEKRSFLVWRQIEYIATVLNDKDLFCWGIQCIGSDFDGIVNPIKKFWTSENMDDLAKELIKHASSFLKNNREKLKPYNQLTPETIVALVMEKNALEFIKNNYI